MKTKAFFLSLVAGAAMVACKKDQTGTDQNGQPTVNQKENFSVELNVITEKDDDFAVYYTEDGSINFDADHVVWHGVKARPESQKVTIDLPEEIVPTDIRIDFGIKRKQDQGDVTLEKFKISYYGKNFEARGSDFLKYFVKNDSIESVVDDAKGTITFHKNLKNSVTPFYYPSKPILDEIAKMTK